MNNQPNDPFDELMRRSLAEEADRIEPTDALPEILDRAHAVRRPVARRPWVVTAGLAAVGTAAAVGAFTVFNGNFNTADEGDAVAGQGTVTSAGGAPTTTPDTPRSEPTKAPTVRPSEATSASPQVGRGMPEQVVSNKAVPVYWLGSATAGKPTQKAAPQTRSSTRLYRTWSRVNGRPAYQAVRIMTSKQPSDADYYSLWKGAEVGSVTLDGAVVTVDFKRFPEGRVDEETAHLAAQQLVYTVQGALEDSTRPIQVTQRGRTGVRLFGQVDTSLPLGRAQALDVQALVSIESPTEGALVSGGVVTVQGTAAAYEATVNYRATNLKTGKQYSSVVNTSEGQKFSPFTIELKLEPGAWQIEAYLLSGEDSSVSDLDTKTIEVR
ncbi:Gmad2 immunoglobulin-like domain-containing protein [Kribbella sp. NPDC056345]|uniref:Gmad2 immunoglobulin-like domain-containing protein n=1 Tax=Kribbella sp. NPDC056345 TaxID=3345789 RepID=UPI0035DC7622